MIYRRGSRGEMVKQIQRALAGAGLRVIDDGIYGIITEEAVKTFQREHGLKADGIVGPATIAKLFPMRFRKSKRTITDIVVHCTATKSGVDYTVNDIRKWHKNRGFSDIGYHYVVNLHGEILEGRDIDIMGAHVSGHNAHSIGVVYIGGINQYGACADTRNNAQKAALMSLLMDLRKLYPKAKISGHRDFSPDLNGNGTVEPSEWIKECPCFDAKAEYKKI